MPVDPSIRDGEREAAAAKYGLRSDKLTVLFVGGSLGAARLNELAIAVARSSERSFQVLHLTGRRYHAEVSEALGAVPEGVVLVDYEDRMADAYAVADVVVCRCGSSTLGELCAVGRASILIPSPNVTENHQEENARGLAEAGAAEILVEADWDTASAVERVVALVGDREHLATMAAAARGLARMDAATRAADAVERVLRDRAGAVPSATEGGVDG